MSDAAELARKRVTPSADEAKSKERIAQAAYSLVEKEADGFPGVVGLEFGGSYGKGTWLAGDSDIDIFVRFKESVTASEFEESARKMGFAALKDHSPLTRYSDHPYVEGRMGDSNINVVPCYDVEHGRWKSAADRSTYHTRFMSENLTPDMRAEVRLLKLFLKSNGIYGAEIAKQGFSGYVSEVLVLNFGTFEGVMEGAAGFREGQVVGKAGREFETPISIIDPIDQNRNLAAAISRENVARLVLAARAYKERPSPEFFERKMASPSKEHLKNVLVVRFRYAERSPDVIWGQVKRLTSTLATQLGGYGFGVVRSGSFTDQGGSAAMLFLLDETEIPRVYEKDGPDFFRRDSAQEFISANLASTEMMWVRKDGSLASLGRREFPKAASFARDFMKNPKRDYIPKGLQHDIEGGFEVSYGTAGLDEPIKEAIDEMVSTDGAILHFGKKPG